MGSWELEIGHRASGIGHWSMGNKGRVYLICRYLIMYLGEPAPTKRPIIPG